MRIRNPSPAARQHALAYNRAYYQALRRLAQAHRHQFERILAELLDDERQARRRRDVLEQAAKP